MVLLYSYDNLGISWESKYQNHHVKIMFKSCLKISPSFGDSKNCISVSARNLSRSLPGIPPGMMDIPSIINGGTQHVMHLNLRCVYMDCHGIFTWKYTCCVFCWRCSAIHAVHSPAMGVDSGMPGSARGNPGENSTRSGQLKTLIPPHVS